MKKKRDIINTQVSITWLAIFDTMDDVIITMPSIEPKHSLHVSLLNIMIQIASIYENSPERGKIPIWIPLAGLYDS